VETLKELHITISMDGKGRAADNAFIERWFRTLKQNMSISIRLEMVWNYMRG
jgi:transposase InsO family protein